MVADVNLFFIIIHSANFCAREIRSIWSKFLRSL